MMNQNELISEIAEKTGLSKKIVDDVILKMLETITARLSANDSVRFPSFGTFEPFLRTERNGVNPQNPQEKIRIPAVRLAKFRAGYRLKNAIKGVIMSEREKQELIDEKIKDDV